MVGGGGCFCTYDLFRYVYHAVVLSQRTGLHHTNLLVLVDQTISQYPTLRWILWKGLSEFLPQNVAIRLLIHNLFPPSDINFTHTASL